MSESKVQVQREKKRVTMRKSLMDDLKQARRTAMRCRRALSTLPGELLDLPLDSVFCWFWKSKSKVMLSCDMSLGEQKDALDFRPVSSQLLIMSGATKVETTPNIYYPGRFDQKFQWPGINVTLSWIDPALAAKPCHKIKVNRVVEVSWCGDEYAPPLNDGDVVITEEEVE